MIRRLHWGVGIAATYLIRIQPLDQTFEGHILMGEAGDGRLAYLADQSAETGGQVDPGAQRATHGLAPVHP